MGSHTEPLILRGLSDIYDPKLLRQTHDIFCQNLMSCTNFSLCSSLLPFPIPRSILFPDISPISLIHFTRLYPFIPLFLVHSPTSPQTVPATAPFPARSIPGEFPDILQKVHPNVHKPSPKGSPSACKLTQNTAPHPVTCAYMMPSHPAPLSCPLFYPPIRSPIQSPHAIHCHYAKPFLRIRANPISVSRITLPMYALIPYTNPRHYDSLNKTPPPLTPPFPIFYVPYWM